MLVMDFQPSDFVTLEFFMNQVKLRKLVKNATERFLDQVGAVLPNSGNFCLNVFDRRRRTPE